LASVPLRELGVLKSHQINRAHLLTGTPLVGRRAGWKERTRKKEWVEEGIMAWSRISSDILFIDFFLSKALE